MHVKNSNTPISGRQTLRYFAGKSLQHKRTLLLSILVPVGVLCLNTLLPYITGKLLAALSVDPETATRYLPFLALAGIAGVACHRIGAANLFEHQARVMSGLQMLCLQTLLKQSAGFHNNRVAGKLVSDAIDFPNSYNILSNALMLNIIPLSITITLGIVLVSLQSWLLGLPLLGMVFVAVGVTIIRSKQRAPIRARRLAASKTVTAHLADTIINNQTVKTFAREQQEVKTHRKLSDHLTEIRINDWRSGARDGNNRMAGLLAFQLLFAVTIIHVVSADPTLLGIGIFAFTYSVTLSNNLFTINNLARQIEDGLLQAEPFMEILQQTPEIQDKVGSKQLVVGKGTIKFDDVHFAYADSSSDESVFERLNLVIASGEKVGLVGPSGGGKSTLTRLLLRFDDIQDGAITIDGQNIAGATQQSLRNAIAYVPQEPLMFHRSILENIAYGKLNATKESIVAAARQANAHDFIERLPDGYDTLVGERGVKLSGGQRQRIAIARAVLKDAPILVLDEATSALDSESEVLIQGALKELMKGRTTIVIAHRLSTIQKMDRIVVLEEGRVAEQGTHQGLLQHKGTYAKLWKHQSGGFLEE